MKQPYVPLDKKSKKQQKEYHSKQRREWGNVNPVTKKLESAKVYSRKKSKQGWHAYDSGLDFFIRLAAVLLIFVFVLQNTSVSVNARQSFREIPISIGEYGLDGLLLRPRGGVPPVAILIHGSGQTDMNSNLGGVELFRDIAHGLGEAGIASVRFNKRFYQHPPIPLDMTIHSEVLEDVSYAVHWAYNNTALGDIYLVGFSLGGILAPTIAHQHDGMIAGIVSMAGSPRPFSEIFVSQSDMLSYMSARTFSLYLPTGLPVGHMLNLFLSADPELLSEMYHLNSWARWLGFPIPYLLSLREICTRSVIDDLHVRKLILHGSEDLQLFAAHDFVAWQELLVYRDNATFILYDGLNHFFTPHVPELGYWQTVQRSRVDARVIEDIARWINE